MHCCKTLSEFTQELKKLIRTLTPAYSRGILRASRMLVGSRWKKKVSGSRHSLLESLCLIAPMEQVRLLNYQPSI